MTVDSGSMTMAAYALSANDPLVEAIVMSLIDNGSIMARDIPFTTKATLKVNGSRVEGNLPTPNWATINSEPVASIGVPTPYQEVAYIIRESVDVDKYLVQDENQITPVRESQVDMHLKAIAYDFNDKFFNNDHVSGNANAIVGLKYRINNGSTYGVRAENKIDAGGVDMTQATLTTSTSKDKANIFLELLDQLLWSVGAPDGSPSVVLYMNEVMKRRFNLGLRALGTDGGLAIDKDQFGRTITSYKSCPVVDPGYKADQSTRIITTTETAAGAPGSSTFTSIYAVNYGPMTFHGWQFEALAAHDLGLMNNGTIFRTVIDWAGGLINDSNRSLARLYDIKLA